MEELKPVAELEEQKGTRATTSSLLIHGDVLEAIMSRVSVLDLLSASRVSKAWRRAVSSSLCGSPRPVPWLLLRHPNRRPTTHAYDPLARAWVSIPGAPSPPPSAPGAPLCPAPGGLLFVLTPSKLALSSDPLGAAAAWRELEAPRVWRRDPVVAAVGPRVVAAGGGLEFEDDARAVEVCHGGAWESCERMPEDFRESASAMWLSVAASERRMYVLEKRSGWASWFDPEKGKWGATRQVQPASAIPVTTTDGNHNQWLWAIGHDKDDRVILVGACGRGGGSSIVPEGVALWAMDGEKLEVEEEMGRMPRELVEGLVARGDDGDSDDGGLGEGLTGIGFCCGEGVGYVFNPTQPREFFLFELSGGSKSSSICRWERIPAPAAVRAGGAVLHRFLTGCSLVSRDNLVKILPTHRD